MNDFTFLSSVLSNSPAALAVINRYQQLLARPTNNVLSQPAVDPTNQNINKPDGLNAIFGLFTGRSNLSQTNRNNASTSNLGVFLSPMGDVRLDQFNQSGDGQSSNVAMAAGATVDGKKNGNMAVGQTQINGGGNFGLLSGIRFATLDQGNINLGPTNNLGNGNVAFISDNDGAVVNQNGVATTSNLSEVVRNGAAQIKVNLLGDRTRNKDVAPANISSIRDNGVVAADFGAIDANNQIEASGNTGVAINTKATSTDATKPVNNDLTLNKNLMGASNQVTVNGDVTLVASGNGAVQSGQTTVNGSSALTLISEGTSADVTQASSDTKETVTILNNVSQGNVKQAVDQDGAAGVFLQDVAQFQVVQGRGASDTVVREAAKQQLTGQPANLTITSEDAKPDTTAGVTELQLNRAGTGQAAQDLSASSGNANITDQDGVGDVVLGQKSNQSGNIDITTTNRIGNAIGIAQDTRNGTGNAGATVDNAVVKTIAIAQNSNNGGDLKATVKNTLASGAPGDTAPVGINIVQGNQTTEADTTPNTLAITADGTVILGGDASAETLNTKQFSEGNAKSITTQVSNSVQDTNIEQSTNGTVTDGVKATASTNIGTTRVTQSAQGTDAAKPITASTTSTVTDNEGLTVQGSFTANNNGDVVIVNDKTSGAVSISNAEKDGAGKTDITVTNAKPTDNKGAFATSFVDGSNNRAEGDVAVASTRQGASGDLTVKLDNNQGNQTVNANDKQTGNQSVTVSNLKDGIATVVGTTQAAEDKPTTATISTKVENVNNGQVAVTNTATNTGNVQQTVNNVDSGNPAKPDVKASAGDLGASADVAVVGDKSGGSGKISQTVTNVNGTVGMAARSTDTTTNAQNEGGIQQSVSNVADGAAIFASNTGNKSGVTVEAKNVGGSGINVDTTNLLSGGGTTIKTSNATTINQDIKSLNSGKIDVTSSNANLINTNINALNTQGVDIKTNDAATINLTGTATKSGPVNLDTQRAGTVNMASAINDGTGAVNANIKDVGTVNLVGQQVGADGTKTITVSNADTVQGSASLTGKGDNKVGITANNVNVSLDVTNTKKGEGTANTPVNSEVTLNSRNNQQDVAVIRDQGGAAGRTVINANLDNGSKIYIAGSENRVIEVNSYNPKGDNTGNDIFLREGSKLEVTFSQADRYQWMTKDAFDQETSQKTVDQTIKAADSAIKSQPAPTPAPAAQPANPASTDTAKAASTTAEVTVEPGKLSADTAKVADAPKPATDEAKPAEDKPAADAPKPATDEAKPAEDKPAADAPKPATDEAKPAEDKPAADAPKPAEEKPVPEKKPEPQPA